MLFKDLKQHVLVKKKIKFAKEETKKGRAEKTIYNNFFHIVCSPFMVKAIF
jgi:hypothetical protein